MDPNIARRTWRTVEPYHGIIYFAPEAGAAYEALGLQGMQGYFASRSASLGPASAELVKATFYNFHPDMVESAMATAWDITTPAAVHQARVGAADGVLRRTLGEAATGPEVARAAELATIAAREAMEHAEGRPLFAGHCTLPWPDEPHLVLWHAQMLLREFRGDGHVAALMLEGLSGLDAVIIHVATGEVSKAGIQMTRRWSDDEWQAGIQSLAKRGLVDADGALTADGQAHRAWVEDRTDRAAVGPYAALGEDGCTELRRLVRPLCTTILESGVLPHRAPPKDR